ncbi:MAG TPA: M48 family metallopeptidase, partial [Bryobacteraceae bacterium]|nr:M48 family metallopeptidase [Bryobacteraceae bacterium]
IGVGLWVGIPMFTAAAAKWIPPSAEEKLGRLVADQFSPPDRTCTSSELQSATDEIVQRLERHVDGNYEYRVRVAEAEMMNAVAAPGGHIVVFRDLLQATGSPDELASVLAHEMQHVAHQHSTQALVRQLGVRGLFLLTGADGSQVWEAVAQLGGLRFQRKDEEQADAEAMRTLVEAGVPLSAMASMFRKLERVEGELPREFEYLSTHPNTKERVLAIEREARDRRVTARPFRSSSDWTRIRHLCR